MKLKGLLFAAFVLDFMYGFTVFAIFACQSILYELSISDLQQVTIYPFFIITEAVVLFCTIIAFVVLLERNTAKENGNFEKGILIVVMVVSVIKPFLSTCTSVITSQMYAVSGGVDMLAAYSCLQSYLNFASLFLNAAIVLLLAHTGITYGRKTRQNNIS